MRSNADFIDSAGSIAKLIELSRILYKKRIASHFRYEAILRIAQISVAQKSNGFANFCFLIGQRQADLNAQTVRLVVFQRDHAVAAAYDAIDNGKA